MRKLIPPVMVPVTFRELISSTIEAIKPNSKAIFDLNQKVAEYVGSNYVISTSSGRTALYTILKAYGLEEGDEVVLPAYMCSSVSDLLFEMKLNINFVDVDPHTYTIDPHDLNEKICKNTKAVVAAHMFGIPCDMNSIMEIARDNGSRVIEDSAQSMGAKYNNKKVGTIGDSGFFSFGRGKPLTSMGGGSIVTSDQDIYQKCQNIVNNFSNRNRISQSKLLLKMLGYSLIRSRSLYKVMHNRIRNESTRACVDINNVEMPYTNFQAKMASLQLLQLDWFNEIRKRNAQLIYSKLKNNNHVGLVRLDSNIEPFFLRYPIKINSDIRNELILKLKSNGIETSVVYPESLSKFYGSLAKCKNAEQIVKETVALPVHPQVTETDINKMVETINKIV